jgi:hypothetical protein
MLLCEYYDCVNENKACMDGNQIGQRSGEFWDFSVMLRVI